VTDHNNTIMHPAVILLNSCNFRLTLADVIRHGNVHNHCWQAGVGVKRRGAQILRTLAMLAMVWQQNVFYCCILCVVLMQARGLFLTSIKQCKLIPDNGRLSRTGGDGRKVETGVGLLLL